MTLEEIIRHFERGIASSGLPRPGESMMAKKVDGIVKRLSTISSASAEGYAFMAGRNAAIDADRRRKFDEMKAAAVRLRTQERLAFIKIDAEKCEALEIAIARAEAHWQRNQVGDTIPEALKVVRAIYIERATDEEVMAMMPGASQDVRHQRKRRGVLYVLQHGSPSSEAVALLSANAARLRAQRHAITK